MVTNDNPEIKDITKKIYNLEGQLIYHKENTYDPTYQFELIASPGVYILELSSQQKKQHYKLIKD